jgi:hypothetical protein
MKPRTITLPLMTSTSKWSTILSAAVISLLFSVPTKVDANIKCPVKTFWGSTEEMCPHVHMRPNTGADQLIRSENLLNENQRRQATFGAIAYSPSSGAFGWAWNQTQIEDARNAAIRSCIRNDCAGYVLWFKDGFGAVAKNQSGAWATSWGTTQTEAERGAVNRCEQLRRSNDPCTVWAVIDSVRGRIR